MRFFFSSVAAAVALAACSSTSSTPGPGSADGAAAPADGAASDAAPRSCPPVAAYCAASPQPVECSGEAAKLAELCAAGTRSLVHVTATSCPGIVAVYVQGVDTATLFYFDASGALVGVNHSGIGGGSCSAAGGGFTPPGNGGGCAANGTTTPACGDAG
jgi:hypothetical protein